MKAPDDNLTGRASRRVAHRLRLAGLGLATFVAIVVIAAVVQRLNSHDRRLSQGHDLLPSYAAGELVRTGHARELYDLPAIQAIEARTARDADLQMDSRYGPWLNPPFFALMFAPLSALPYRTAAACFLAFNMSLLIASVWMLIRMLRPVETDVLGHGRGARATFWEHGILIPLLFLTSMPFWQALCHQQNTFLSLFLLCAAVTCWRSERLFAAGLFAGLLFFKPQLAAVFAVVLIGFLGWQALAGIAVSGVVLLAINLLVLPGTLGDLLHKLSPILHGLQTDSHYNWGRQVTFMGFWRLLIQGHGGGETALIVKLLTRSCSAATAFALTLAAVDASRARQSSNGPASGRARDRLITAAIACMPLLMPYYMDYDLTLLAVPAVLFAADWIARGHAAATRADRWLLAAWVVLFVVTAFNPGFSGQTRFNLTVPALVLLAGASIARCRTPGVARVDLSETAEPRRIAA